MRRIFLNPGDVDDIFGLLLVVAADTGIEYIHQCNGHLVEKRKLEGFAVPVGSFAAAGPFIAFFEREFPGWMPRDGWTAARLEELRQLVSGVWVWAEYLDQEQYGDRSARLEIDTDRITEAVEGWIPVISILGPGALLFRNSD